MFDNTTGDFTSDFDLDEMEAGWPSADTTATEQKPKTRSRPGSDPKWKPRAKDQKIDRTTPEHKAAKLAASFGLPYFSRLQWLQVQLLDKGESDRRGHTRYALKFEASDAPIEHCTRAGLQAMRRVRWANLSTPARFLVNCRKKKDPAVFGEGCMEIARELAAAARTNDAEFIPQGAPESLLGFISTRFEGTVIYPGQYALLMWYRAAGVWLPIASVTQFIPDGTLRFDTRFIPMRLPPAINKNGSKRCSPYSHIGTWFSEALQERITVGREIKAMKAAAAARGERA
jgi:hypothetical protein